MKTFKLTLLTFLITNFAYSQDTLVISKYFGIDSTNNLEQNKVYFNTYCDALWQTMQIDTSKFTFYNASQEKTNYHDIISRVDTIINYAAEHDTTFQTPPFLLVENPYNCQDISKIILYHDDRKIIRKITFFVDVYDNMGNYVNEEQLFFILLKP